MESTIGGEGNFFYASRVVGKRSLEWDPSDWKWDGDLFIATPLNSNYSNYQSRQFFPLETGTPMAARVSSNSSSSCSDEANRGIHRDVSELEKRRRVSVVEDANLDDEAGSLTLKPGGGISGKNTKLPGANSITVVCRVDDCVADLSRAKNYHRRHKVCEMHSKASSALVGNVLQRFCQQCSRFHALQEFDEGKRSCRRRLAGHNRRRRKTEPDAGVNSSSLNDNQATGYLLISLLKILSDMHSNRTNHIGDQDLLSHLLRSLASHGGQYGDKNISGLLQESQNLLNNRPSIGTSDMVSALLSNGPHGSRRLKQHCTVPASTMPHKGLHVDNARVEEIQTTSSERPNIPFPAQYCPPAQTEARDSSAGRSKLNNFDLNDVYIDSDDCIEDVERSPVLENLGAGSLGCPPWVQQGSNQSSPAQTSGNSDSASSQSPSSSSGDTQSRTDRIVFKIFGKEPSDFPFVLRAQILDWLSHSPTDIESYIRPGCIILTIYLRLSESSWEELCSDLSSSLTRLLDVSDNDTFWRTGWIYVLVQNQIAFMYNGQVVVDTYLPFKSNNCSTILSVKPIAISVSERAQFLVKGFNFSQRSMRLSCGVEGNYLVQETNHDLLEGVDSLKGNGELQCLNFSCSIPAVTGRGFIEVEGHAFNSSFFPFIVAEKDVCLEIRMLETEIDLSETDDVQGRTGKMEARNQAMNFLYEMGWLLHRSHSKSKLGYLDPNSDLFPLKRFVWLMEFSMDHDWCAVVKKLLDILLDGTVGAGEQPFLKLALFEMGLLHRAVRRNSRPMVELLLGYVPDKVADELSSEYKSLVGADESFLFRPDVVGPAGLTPLHVAAGRDSSEDVLDAFTDDPGKVGIEAWKNAHDNTGFTPEDYARLRGYYSYIHLVQRKINRKPFTGHVVLDIPSTLSLSDCNAKQKQNEERTASFDIGRTKVKAIKWPCKLCDQKLTYGNASRSLLYRPAMLSMVTVAAVCVCVALLFKSSPEVLYVFRPFRWEKLDFGCS